MPVPLYLSGVVNPDMSGSPSLILNPAVSGKHFETASPNSSYFLLFFDEERGCAKRKKVDYGFYPFHGAGDPAEFCPGFC